MALESASMESASDCAKWTGSSTFLQLQMAQSCESVCWPLTPVSHIAILRLPRTEKNKLTLLDLSASLRSKARNERFGIELHPINRNSCSDSIHGAIQLCALLPVSQKALHRHDPQQPITNA